MCVTSGASLSILNIKLKIEVQSRRTGSFIIGRGRLLPNP